MKVQERKNNVRCKEWSLVILNLRNRFIFVSTDIVVCCSIIQLNWPVKHHSFCLQHRAVKPTPSLSCHMASFKPTTTCEWTSSSRCWFRKESWIMAHQVCVTEFHGWWTVLVISRNWSSHRNFLTCDEFSPVQGGVDSRNLFHDYIMVWVQDMQLGFLDHCKSEKVHLPICWHFSSLIL